MNKQLEDNANDFAKTLDYKFDNINSVDFYYDLVLGGKTGNDLVFEQSEQQLLTEREQTVYSFVNHNPGILPSEKKHYYHIALETKRFYLERCNPVKSMQSMIIMGKSKTAAFFESSFIPKAIAASIFGVFGTLSAGELINFSVIIASGKFYCTYLSVVILLFMAYFAFVDLRYLRPRLTAKEAIIRAIFPTTSMLIYSILLWLGVVGLVGYDGISAIANISSNKTLSFNNVLGFSVVSVSIAIALSSIWDKEAITRPL